MIEYKCNKCRIKCTYKHYRLPRELFESDKVIVLEGGHPVDLCPDCYGLFRVFLGEKFPNVPEPAIGGLVEVTSEVKNSEVKDE